MHISQCQFHELLKTYTKQNFQKNKHDKEKKLTDASTLPKTKKGNNCNMARETASTVNVFNLKQSLLAMNIPDQEPRTNSFSLHCVVVHVLAIQQLHQNKLLEPIIISSRAKLRNCVVNEVAL